jgi:hypothetical protein
MALAPVAPSGIHGGNSSCYNGCGRQQLHCRLKFKPCHSCTAAEALAAAGIVAELVPLQRTNKLTSNSNCRCGAANAF